MRMTAALVSKLQGMLDPATGPPKDPTNDIDKKLRMLLHSDKWPLAVEPSRMCDPNSDDDKLVRAAAILDQVVDVQIAGLRFLDYGCGEGHAAFVASDDAELSVGYDLSNMGWGQFPDRHNFILTDDPSDYHPFDIILMHDVLDHVEDDPIAVLEHARDMLGPRGRLCVLCHPFSSKTGGHNCRLLNRAYSHLFFPEESSGQKVIRPLEEYKTWFSAAGLVIKHERPFFGDVPKLFQLPHLSERIRLIYGEEKLPEEELRVDAIVYSLSKEL
jgi:2-polyprenyl-3-methyl-5-hydroxy-6-metoxy-1,4-benzoquinol methylase